MADVAVDILRHQNGRVFEMPLRPAAAAQEREAGDREVDRQREGDSRQDLDGRRRCDEPRVRVHQHKRKDSLEGDEPIRTLPAWIDDRISPTEIGKYERSQKKYEDRHAPPARRCEPRRPNLRRASADIRQMAAGSGPTCHRFALLTSPDRPPDRRRLVGGWCRDARKQSRTLGALDLDAAATPTASHGPHVILRRRSNSIAFAAKRTSASRGLRNWIYVYAP